MSPDDSPLLFHHKSRRVRRRPLQAFLTELAAKVARGRTVTCLITNDRRMRVLNQQFRGKRTSTDVLSFPSSGDPGSAGELAISLDRAAVQAEEQGHSLDDELRILMLHGVLHLAGMDHEKDSGQMAKAEMRWRKRLNLPVGLVERAAARQTLRKPGARGRAERIPTRRALIKGTIA